MKLTVRTLLAYLDDVLDPAEKEELAQKIESNDFAKDLVHRTRDTVRRLRLSAPQVIGTGMALDPNSVAEFLDNVLPPDAMGHFERICLESDVHLAEAAACHHVLTMILGQPADVDPIARQRMYTIATEAGERKRLRMEPAHDTAAGRTAAAAPVQRMAVPVAAPQQRVEIPEYLRAGAWWTSWKVLAALAATVMIGIAIWLATRGSSNSGSAVTAVSADTDTTSADNGTANTGAGADQTVPNGQNEPVAAAGTQTAPVAPTSSAPQQTSTTPATTNATPPTTPAPTIAASNGAPANPVAATSPGAAANSTPTNTGAQPAPGNAVANVPSSPVGPPAASVTKSQLPSEPAANVPPAPTAGTTNPGAVPLAANDVPAAPAPFDTDAPPIDKLPAVPRPQELGTYMGGKTVLLRYDNKAGTWFRVEPRAAVVAGMKLLALPEFRPKIALLSGMNLDLSGGTQIVVGNGGGVNADVPAAKADIATARAAVTEIPMIELVYGRIVLVNSANAENRVRLKLGPSSGEAQLGRNAALAVEVERKFVPGQDPVHAAAPIECRLYSPDGLVTWKDGAGSKTVEKPSRWTVGVAGATEPVADSSPPGWIYDEPIGQLIEHRDGAQKVESTLVSNTPANTQLVELYQGSKQRYVKSLVARSSIYVGLFEPFIDALRDSEQRANWKAHIDTLRAAMALSPESAEKVTLTLEEQRGKPAAKDLYEMLCGYSADQIGHTPEQMKTGAIATLIGRLESDSLDYRVLAVQDLAEITGKRFMLNAAEPSLALRTQSIRRWRDRLKEGDLKLVAQPQ